MQTTLQAIQTALREQASPDNIPGIQRFFKEDISAIGVRMPAIRTIVSRTKRSIAEWDKPKVWMLCDALWSSGNHEQGHIPAKLADTRHDLNTDDFAVFEGWLEKFIHNWAHCDDLCTHALGRLIHDEPSLFPRMAAWITSENRWLRRASCVSLLVTIKQKHGVSIDDALLVCMHLLQDQDDLVQKGLAWLLKESGARFPGKTTTFLLNHGQMLPRATLRTAVKKLPGQAREHLLKRS